MYKLGYHKVPVFLKRSAGLFIGSAIPSRFLKSFARLGVVPVAKAPFNACYVAGVLFMQGKNSVKEIRVRETSAALVRSRWPCNSLCQRSPSSSLVGGPFTLRVHSASRLGLVKHPCLSASGLGGLVCSLLLCHTVVGIVDTLHRQDNQGSACVRYLHYLVSPRRGKRQEVYADIALCSSRRRALSLRHVHGAPPFCPDIARCTGPFT